MHEFSCCPKTTSIDNLHLPTQFTSDIWHRLYKKNRSFKTFEISNLMVGDLLVFYSENVISKIIEKFLQVDQAKARFTHVGMYVGRGRIIHNNPYYLAFEIKNRSISLVKGINYDLMFDQRISGRSICFSRMKGISNQNRIEIAQKAVERLGEPYNLFPAIQSQILKYIDPNCGSLGSNKISIDDVYKEISALSNMCSTFIEECFVDTLGNECPMIGSKNLPFSIPSDFLDQENFEILNINPVIFK